VVRVKQGCHNLENLGKMGRFKVGRDNIKTLWENVSVTRKIFKIIESRKITYFGAIIMLKEF